MRLRFHKLYGKMIKKNEEICRETEGCQDDPKEKISPHCDDAIMI